MEFICGDIHQEILKLETDSIDMIYTNPPFGITKKKWDKSLDWDTLFPEMDRVLKSTGSAVIHTSIPFTYTLIAHRKPRYHYTWMKENSTNFFSAKRQPLRILEEILIYNTHRIDGSSVVNGVYNPQMTGTMVTHSALKSADNDGYYGGGGKNRPEPHTGRYPTTFLGKFKRVKKGGKSTPKEIVEQMILSYTEPGQKVLDMTHHNQYVGEICVKLGRTYLGIDVAPEFY